MCALRSHPNGQIKPSLSPRKKFVNVCMVNFPWTSPLCSLQSFTLLPVLPLKTLYPTTPLHCTLPPPPLLPSPHSYLPACTSPLTNTPTLSSSYAVVLVTDPTCAPCSGWWGRRRSTSARVGTGTSAPSAAGGRKSGTGGVSRLSQLHSGVLAFHSDSATFRDASVGLDPFLADLSLLHPGLLDLPAWF